MIVILNGKENEISDKMNLLELLKSKDIEPDSVVVEHNKEIVTTENFGNITLNDGDHLEVLRFVGGG